MLQHCEMCGKPVAQFFVFMRVREKNFDGFGGLRGHVRARSFPGLRKYSRGATDFGAKVCGPSDADGERARGNVKQRTRARKSDVSRRGVIGAVLLLLIVRLLRD